MVTATLSLSLACAVVADVGVPRQPASRPGPGTVRDVPLSFGPISTVNGVRSTSTSTRHFQFLT